MTTQVVFELLSDEEELNGLTAGLTQYDVMFWRIAIFCCQQQLEKCLRRDAVKDHYDSIHMRAKATRDRLRG